MSSSTTEAAQSLQTDDYFCEVPSSPVAVVMFGASGDLAKRKLLPALYDLAIHSCLGPRFRLLGFARTEMTDEKFRSGTDEALPQKGGDVARRNFLKESNTSPGITTIRSLTSVWRRSSRKSTHKAILGGIDSTIFRRRRRSTRMSSSSSEKQVSQSPSRRTPGRGSLSRNPSATMALRRAI